MRISFNILSVNQILSPHLWHASRAYIYRQMSQIYRQTLTLSKCFVYFERASLENVGIFTLLNCYFFQYFVGTNDMLVGLHVPTNFLIYRQTVTLSKCMCMRASGASELRKFWHFYILNLLFLSIFCRYIRYFVGTNDMLVGSHVPTNFQMYRQKSEKALLGGGGAAAPPAPPLATLMCGRGVSPLPR